MRKEFLTIFALIFGMIFLASCEDKKYESKALASGYYFRVQRMTQEIYAKAIFELENSKPGSYKRSGMRDWLIRTLKQRMIREFRRPTFFGLRVLLETAISELHKSSTKTILSRIHDESYTIENFCYYEYNDKNYYDVAVDFKKQYLTFKNCMRDSECRRDQLCYRYSVCVERKFFPGYQKPASRPASRPTSRSIHEECSDNDDCPSSKPYCLEHDCVKDKPERK